LLLSNLFRVKEHIDVVLAAPFQVFTELSEGLLWVVVGADKESSEGGFLAEDHLVDLV